MPSTPAHTLRASQHLRGHSPELGPCPPLGPGDRPRLPSGKGHPRPVLLALVSDSHPGPWMNSEPEHKRGEKRRSPQVKPVCLVHTRKSKGGGGTRRAPVPGAPLLVLGSRLWGSSWDPRQPISEPRRRLISMRCACAHLPPGGGVWLRRNSAEPQVRPACPRSASGRIWCRESWPTPLKPGEMRTVHYGLWIPGWPAIWMAVNKLLKLAKQVSFLV